MHYNIKIIDYPNGETQIRRYSVPLRCKEDKPDVDDWELQVIEPFSGDLVREVDDFFPDKEISEEEKERNRYRNANRTKQSVFMYARCVEWEWFITLTFSGEKVNRYDYEECSNRARKFMNNQRNRYAPDLQYLLVPEQHKDGAWHFHGLLARTGNMRFFDSGIRDKGQVVYNMVKWQYGFTTATKVKDVHKVAKYVGKYITKHICDCTPGKQRYFVSRNIPLPKVSVMYCEDGEINKFLEKFEESSGKRISHVSQTRDTDSYTQVTYFEFV